MMAPLLLAVEDPLGESVARQLLRREGLAVTQVLGLRGKSYLQQKAESLNATAKGFPIFLLTDLDDPGGCPSALISTWLPSGKHENFLLRIAVLEVEAWLLAHQEALASFLSVPSHRLPTSSETIPHPKEFLVRLCRSSRSSIIRRDLVPATGSTSKVGPAYNSRLREFVDREWDPQAASKASRSLLRTLERLAAFRARMAP